MGFLYEETPKRRHKRKISYIDLKDNTSDEEEKEDLSNNNDDEIQIVSIYSEGKESSSSTRPMRKANDQERTRTTTPTKEKPDRNKSEMPETPTDPARKKTESVSSEPAKVERNKGKTSAYEEKNRVCSSSSSSSSTLSIE